VLSVLWGLILFSPQTAQGQPGDPSRDKAPSTSAKSLEWLVAPVVSYDSYLGPGFGAFANVARLDPARLPYRYRLSGQVFFNVARAPDGSLNSPYQHHYVLLDVPGLAAGRLRLNLDLRFRRQTSAGYYGLGNASINERPEDNFDPETQPGLWAEARRFHQFARTFPSLRGTAQWALSDRLRAFAALGLAASWITIYPGSRLSQDAENRDSGAGSPPLFGLSPHALLDGSAGIVWDSRDDEFEPARGAFADLSVRGGVGLPGPGTEPHFSYFGLNLTARGFTSLWQGGVTLAVRGRIDLLLGNPPLYALAEVGGLVPDRWATGGGTSLRGVLLQRYHAKIKLQANLELRAGLARFRLFGRSSRLSMLGFVDLGRFFADWTPQPALDGSGLGIKVAFGGGLRLRFGRTLIVRADVGVSADGMAAYVDIDHVF